MNTISRTYVSLGALFAALAVMAGAFGAHALRDLVPAERLVTFETAARYQMYHALALVLIGLGLNHARDRKLTWAGILFIAGIVIFSGSLYVLVLTGITWLGAITPLGGVCFIAGWLFFALAAYAGVRQ